MQQAVAPAPPAAAAVLDIATDERTRHIATLDWPALRDAVAGCQACALCQSRKQTVFGVGDRQARWMIVGEAPGEQEDLSGEPFVGAAGQLLDSMLRALSRQCDDGPAGARLLPTLEAPTTRSATRSLRAGGCEPFLMRHTTRLTRWGALQ
jgi:DNA polymerase